MIRRDAMETICKQIKNEIIVSANGFISRDVYSSLEKNTQTSSITLLFELK